ncbi:DUF2267 domain-containing protein [Saccharopolyspora sp. 5N102]|uniref:DUF2267 domain-containing protein n=1 Tax=Saccharopolyspora sp. 5N102 TaxID=3375155 RepID=UPI00379CC6AA
MRYSTFIAEVALRTGLREHEGEIVARATLQTLAQRIPEATSARLARELPPELGGLLLAARVPDAEEFDLCEFINRVSRSSGLDSPQSTYGARVVFDLVHGMAEGRTLDAVREALSCDLRVLFDAGRSGQKTP